MKSLRVASLIIAVLIAGGEVARWWGQARMLPMALDELVVAGALVGAALAAPRHGPAPLAVAWGLYCGLMLGLLVPTLDHLMWGPEKESAFFYAAVLGAMLAIGLWGAARALALTRARGREQ
jgi:hypothetical protein